MTKKTSKKVSRTKSSAGGTKKATKKRTTSKTKSTPRAKKASAKGKAPTRTASPQKRLAPTKKRSPAPKSVDEARKAKPPIAQNGVHILVVDDEPEILNLLTPYLKRLGYKVTEAEDGDAGLEKILTHRPDIVLLDVMMPGLNGWEIAQYVRDRPELDSVRIIMATGIGEDMNAATAPLYGADAYLDKPFRLPDVDKSIQHVMRRTGSIAR